MNNIVLAAGFIFVVLAMICLCIVMIDQYLLSLFSKVQQNFQHRYMQLRGVINQQKIDHQHRLDSAVKQINENLQISLNDYMLVLIAHSGFNISMIQFVFISFSTGCFGFFIGLVLKNYGLMIVLTAGLAVLPWLVIRIRYYNRQTEFRQLFGGVIVRIYELYRTNQHLLLAIEKCQSNMPTQYQLVFKQFFNDLENGIPFNRAVDQMVTKVLDPNFRVFCSILKIEHRMGINVKKEIKVIHDQYQDEKKVRFTLDDELKKHRIESIILAVLPFITIFVIFAMDSGGFQTLMSVPWIQNVFTVAVALTFIGYVMLPSILTMEME